MYPVNCRRPIDTAECRSTRYFRCEPTTFAPTGCVSLKSGRRKTRTQWRSSAVCRGDRLAEGEKPRSIMQGAARTSPAYNERAHAGCPHDGGGWGSSWRRGTHVARDTPCTQGGRQGPLGPRQDRQSGCHIWTPCRRQANTLEENRSA